MGISTLLSFIGINLSVAVLDINNVIAHGRFSVFCNFGTHLCHLSFSLISAEIKILVKIECLRT